MGLSYWQKTGLIILPQALRLAVPPTVGFSVQVVKGTALASPSSYVDRVKGPLLIIQGASDPRVPAGEAPASTSTPPTPSRSPASTRAISRELPMQWSTSRDAG